MSYDYFDDANRAYVIPGDYPVTYKAACISVEQLLLQ
jgi:hypothetical protein